MPIAQYTPPTPTRQNSFVALASAVCIGHKLLRRLFRAAALQPLLLAMTCNGDEEEYNDASANNSYLSLTHARRVTKKWLIVRLQLS